MSDKEQFARDRMREDDESLALEYSEREYLAREKTRTGQRFPADDEQPEPTAERHNTKTTCQR